MLGTGRRTGRYQAVLGWGGRVVVDVEHSMVLIGKQRLVFGLTELLRGLLWQVTPQSGSIRP